MKDITNTLTAELREDTGSAASRRLRKAGKTPAVLYSVGKEGKSLALDTREIQQFLNDAELSKLVIGKEETVVMAQDATWDSLKDELIHVDLLEVDFDREIVTTVPVKLVGNSIGLQKGGVMDQMPYEIDVRCLPSNLPERVEVDITELAIGQNIKISELDLGEGLKAVYKDPTRKVCQIFLPRAARKKS